MAQPKSHFIHESPVTVWDHTWVSFHRILSCLGQCAEDLQKQRTTADLSCYKSQPELLSLGFSSFYRDVSSVSCSSDFEVPSPNAPSYSDARNKNTNKQKIAAGGQFSSDLVMFSLVTLRAKKTCHLFFFFLNLLTDLSELSQLCSGMGECR